MKLHADSHVDHVPATVIEQTLARFAGRDRFFIESFELSPDSPPLDCGIYGPVMGDPPVPESEVVYEPRGSRPYPSRVVDRPFRPTRIVTVIAGAYGDDPCVLYTVFGGPASPKEPADPNLHPNERAESEAFWAEHALARN